METVRTPAGSEPLALINRPKPLLQFRSSVPFVSAFFFANGPRQADA